MSHPPLSTGAVARAQNNDTTGSPTLQIVDLKHIQQTNSTRYRLLISDGQSVMQGMLATQLNHLVEQQQVRQWSVVRLEEFICNIVQNRKVAILLNISTLAHVEQCIGNPVHENGTPVVHQQQPPPQQMPPQQMPPQQQGYQQGAPPPQHNPYGAPVQNAYQPPPQQQQYGAPAQQQQYGAPGPQYGGSPQQPPPPQQQQQYGAPQQQYGQPPPQQQYGQPQQQYGQPANPYQAPQQQPPPQNPYQAPQQQNMYQNQNNNPYQNAPPPQQMNPYANPPAPSAYGDNGAVQRDHSATIMPISALNPYQNKWTIRARIMEKDTRNYSNAKGDGKLFNLLAADATGDIRITGFNETHDAHYDRLVVGRVYDLSGGSLKPKNAQYNTTSHQFEITLNRSCTVEEVEEPGGHEAIPKYSFRFTPIPQLEETADESKVDVLGVVVECGEAVDFTAKSGKEMTKRVMSIADTSGRGIEVTIFGKPTQTIGQGSVVALKAAKVGSWNTKSLTMWTDAAITPHPDMPEAHQLVGWWQQGGQHQQVNMISVAGGGGGGGRAARRIVFSEIDDLALGLNAEPDVFTVRATLTHIKTDGRTMWYIACPTCKKKVGGADEDNLQGHCEKCGKTVMGARRWIFTATCADTTGSRYISFFDDQAVTMLGGKTADELAPLKMQDEQQFGHIFLGHSFKTYLMKCRVKNEMYLDEQKLKVSAIHLAPIDWKDEGRKMLDDINGMMQMAY